MTEAAGNGDHHDRGRGSGPSRGGTSNGPADGSKAEEVAPPRVPAADAAAWTDRHASEKATRAADARKVSGRRRLIDPTTCDRDYSKAEMEFMQAMSEYKQSSGRMFPTWSEVLEVLRDLGYEKSAPALNGAVPVRRQGWWLTGAGRPRS